MAGIIRVDVLRWRSNNQLGFRPYACPMGEHREPTEDLYCYTLGDLGETSYCPYYVYVAVGLDSRNRVDPEGINAAMAARGDMATKASIMCAQAKPTTRPGA